MARAEVLQRFLDAASVAFEQCAPDQKARQSTMQIFASLRAVKPRHGGDKSGKPIGTTTLTSLAAAIVPAH